MRWGSVKLDYDGSGNLEYVSRHTQHKAPQGSPGWYITKLTWSGGNVTNWEELQGAYTKRTILDWE